MALSERPVPRWLVALAAAMMLAGLWSGLARIGWGLPTAGPLDPAAHGVVFVSGFFGALISLERAVALGRRWTVSAAPLAVAGVAVWSLGDPARLGSLAVLGAALAFTAASLVLVRLQPSAHMGAMAVGAGCWAVAAGLAVGGRPMAEQVPWLAGFLVLTVAGERLELSRVGPPSPGKLPAFAVAAALVVAGLLVGPAAAAAGGRLLGLGLLALAGWMAVFDIARRTVRFGGVTRFIALCLLSGYLWLAVGGTLWLAAGRLAGGLTTDAALHAVFVGFVFSMVFGHVHLVAPALLRVDIPYTPWFTAHLVLLHLGLVVRVTGDLASQAAWRRWGGLLNAAAVLLFLVGTVAAVAAGRRRAGAAEASPRPAMM